VKLSEVELRRVSLPLATPFRSSRGTETARDVLLVKVASPEGEGWGECVAPSEPGYTSEYTDGAEQVIRRHLLPRLFAAGDVTAAGVGPLLSGVVGHQMAKAALETAVLDAELRARGESFATHLGAVRDRVPAGVAVGITGSVSELADRVAELVAAGYRRVKLKVEPGWDLEPVAAVRDRFPDLALQVDANGAYTLADTARLAALDPFGLLLVEQPLPTGDLLGHAELARRIATPVCLDESIDSLAAAVTALELGACSVVNIKAGRVGGWYEARRIHDLCASRGIPVWCGGMLETGLGRAGNVALAALPNFSLPGDLSASERYFPVDLTPPFRLDDGHLRVPDGPGLGAEPIPEVLAAHTTACDRINPGN
jgi:O-succinylbenzoate synthase